MTTGAIVCVVVAVISAGNVDAGPSEIHGAPVWFPVSVLSTPDQAIVTWQLRAESPVRIRLYRLAPGGGAHLVGEVAGEPGVAVYRMTDDARPPGPFVYQIRVVGFGERERTLGSLPCVDPGLSGSTATVTWDASHLVADPSEATELYRPVGRQVDPLRSIAFRAAARCPDPPVPRSDRRSRV